MPLPLARIGSLIPPVAPSLPRSPGTYSTLFQEQYSNALRLYFNRLDSTIQELIVSSNIPFYTRVAQGEVQGYSAMTIFGYNADIDTSEETVWADGGVIPLRTTGIQMTVSSSSTSDTSAGTGARTVLVTGLDANYAVLTETVTLNGQTAVTMTNSFMRVNGITVLTAGSGGVNAGNIYVGTGSVTSGVPATIYEIAPTGANKTESAQYTVPAGYTAYIYDGGVTCGQASGSTSITARLVTTTEAGLRYNVAVTTLNNGISNYQFTLPLEVPEKTNVQATALGSAANNQVSAYFNIMLVQN